MDADHCASQTVTLTFPLREMGPIHVTAPAPALITRHNAAHLGLLPRELLDVLRSMRADPGFRDEVITRGKLRGASPDAVIRFLRRPVVPVAVEGDAALDAAFRKELRFEPVVMPRSRSASRRARAGAR